MVQRHWRRRQPIRARRAQCGLRFVDEALVQRTLKPVVLRLRAVGILVHEEGALGNVQDSLQVKLCDARKVAQILARTQALGMSDRFIDGAETQLSEVFTDLLGDEGEEVDHVLGTAGELAPQRRILGGNTDWAGVQVADAHHDAALNHQRSGSKTKLLSAQQHRDHDIATGLELAIALHADAVAQPVEHQGLLGFSEPQLPRTASVLEAGQRRSTSAAIVAGDQHNVGMRLRHTSGNSTHTLLGDELHVNAGARIGVLEVVNELRQILNRVDVVMRWWRDQTHARGGDAHFRNPRVDLVRWQLATFAGLCTLGHLNLDVGAVGQVVAGHTEAARRYLLDGRAFPITVGLHFETVWIFAALAGIGHRTQAIHSDGQRLMCLRRDGAVAHRTSGKTLDDAGNRLDLINVDRLAVRGELEHAAQGCQLLGLLIDLVGVVAEDRVLTSAGRMLQRVDGLRVE